jgi:hypothetical protein
MAASGKVASPCIQTLVMISNHSSIDGCMIALQG